MESNRDQNKENQSSKNKIKKKRKKKKKRERKKENNRRKVKILVEKWKIWNEEEKVARSEEEAKKLVPERFHK